MWLLALKIVVEKFSTAEKAEKASRDKNSEILLHTSSIANSDLIFNKFDFTATLHIQFTQPSQI